MLISPTNDLSASLLLIRAAFTMLISQNLANFQESGSDRLCCSDFTAPADAAKQIHGERASNEKCGLPTPRISLSLSKALELVRRKSKSAAQIALLAPTCWLRRRGSETALTRTFAGPQL